MGMTSKFEEKSPDESAKAGRVPLAATVSAETFQKLQQWSHKQQKSVGQLLDALISGRQDHTSDQKEGIIDVSSTFLPQKKGLTSTLNKLLTTASS